MHAAALRWRLGGLGMVLVATVVTATRAATPLEEELYRLVLEQGTAAVASRYREAGDLPGPSPLNRTGYRLLGEDRVADAIALFQLNVARHPDDANALDSLAEGYLWAQRYGEAVEQYRRLLEVAPRDRTTAPVTLGSLQRRAREVIAHHQRLAAPAEVEIESPRLQRLAAELRADTTAVPRFLAERQGLGPLAEPTGDPARWLVSFLWAGDDETRSVVVEAPLEAREPTGRAMQRLPGSRLWFATFRLPAGLRLGYLLSPDDPRLTPYGPVLPESLRQRGWRLDPLNPWRERGEGDREWSVLALTGAPPAPWLTGAERDRAASLVELVVPSTALEGERRAWVYTPPPAAVVAPQEPLPLLVFLDGYSFHEIDRVPALLDQLILTRRMRPAAAAFLYGPPQQRNLEMSCHPPTERFLAEELLPLLRRRFAAGHDRATTVLVGRSRSGLGAVCYALARPQHFGKVLAQSGSFWWAPPGEEPEWLARQSARREPGAVELLLQVGALEGSPNPNTGLSMLTVTRHLRDVLRARGYRVDYQLFAGGHDPTAWRAHLPAALGHLLPPVETAAADSPLAPTLRRADGER